jgi:hypothetical protein
VLYCNDAAYDPTSTANLITGQWNFNILGTSGFNLSTTAFARGTVENAIITYELTGVSNLNKQGQMHLFEAHTDTVPYGTSTDTSRNRQLINEYPVEDLPKTYNYKSIDIVNMDSQSAMQHRYSPFSRIANQKPIDLPVATPNSDTTWDLYSTANKVQGLIVNNAAVGTTIRVKYDVVISLAVNNDYISDYPPTFSRDYVNPDPYLAYLTHDKDHGVRVTKRNNDSYYPSYTAEDHKIQHQKDINQPQFFRPKVYIS